MCLVRVPRRLRLADNVFSTWQAKVAGCMGWMREKMAGVGLAPCARQGSAFLFSCSECQGKSTQLHHRHHAGTRARATVWEQWGRG